MSNFNRKADSGRIAVKLDVSDGEDSEVKTFWFALPRFNAAEQLKFQREMIRAHDDFGKAQFNVKMMLDFIDNVKPLTEKGTTVSFEDFLAKEVPNIWQDVINEVIGVAAMSISQLKARDDVEIIAE